MGIITPCPYPPSITGESPVTDLQIRGGSAMSNESLSKQCPLPPGCVAGDLAILWSGGWAQLGSTSGMTDIYASGTTGWGTKVVQKVLTSTDISNGFLEQTFFLSVNWAMAMVVLVGNPSGGVRTTGIASEPGAMFKSIETAGYAQAGDYAIICTTYNHNTDASIDTGDELAQHFGNARGAVINGLVVDSPQKISADFTYPVAPGGCLFGIVVIAGPNTPQFIQNPEIFSETGFYAVGDTLTGLYEHTGTGQTFAWLRGGEVISGATGDTYVLVMDDFGEEIQFRVNATNSVGTTTKDSAATAAIVIADYETENIIDSDGNDIVDHVGQQLEQYERTA